MGGIADHPQMYIWVTALDPYEELPKYCQALSVKALVIRAFLSGLSGIAVAKRNVCIIRN